MKKLIAFLFTSLVLISFAVAQGTETFTSMPANDGAYSLRTWTGDNGLTWTATDARTDQTLNGRAVAIRLGAVSCSGIPNGINALSFSHQQVYSGSGAVLEVYVNSTLLGTVNVTTTSASASFANINVTGPFILMIKQVTPNLRVAIDDITWTGNSTIPPCLEPTTQPSGLNLLATSASVTGNFTAASPAVDGYLIIRSTGNNLTVLPADGTSYSPGQIIGNGTVVTNTSATTFTDNSLAASTQYYYFIFAENDQDCSGSPNYLLSGALTGDVTTGALAACQTPSPVTGLSLSSGNNFIGGSFTPSAGANRYLTLISSSSMLGANPVNGTTYTPGQNIGSGTVLSYNNSTTLSATGLNANSTYFIYVFAAAAECLNQPVYSIVTSSSIATINSSTGIPAGFYDGTAGLSCQPLKTKLKEIASANYTSLSYTPGVWNAYKYTDIKPGTTNVIWDVYTDDNLETTPETYTFIFGTDQCGNYQNEGDCYNREHTTPKSWFSDRSPMITDLQHLYPTDGYVNNKRSNFPYGEVTNATYTSIDNHSKLGTGNNFGYTGIVFEPIDAFKGDLARVSLYMATRYEDEIISQNWAGNAQANVAMLTAAEQSNAAMRRLQVYETWYLKTLFKWIGQDPVSQKEIDRNNGIYYQSGQNNRNPFIDHPEYAAMIWQCTGVVPVTIASFAAVGNKDNTSLTWYATYETSFNAFEIERSTDGTHFNKIGEVAGRNLANYSFVDDQLPQAAVLYYRLRMVDIDGAAKYSSIVLVKRNPFSRASLVYPNPVADMLSIQLEGPLTTNTRIIITDVAGRVVQQQSLSRGEQSFELKVTSLTSGRYFFRITDQNRIIHDSFVVIR